MKNSPLVTTSRSTGLPEYRERLFVPLRWWVQGVMFVATLFLAMVVALPGAWAWAASAALLALLVLAFAAYGSATIEVVQDGPGGRGGHLRAGRARIEATYLGAAEPLDAEATRRAAGVEADARAYLVLRPYLKRAVRVGITDPADPAPYWLVATRHPESLARALAELTGRTTA
jgi:energy-coupling factor transporter transmembrane protein EcfT